MALSETEIKKRELVQESDDKLFQPADKLFRPAGYDVSVREILIVNGKRGQDAGYIPATPRGEYPIERNEEFYLPPQAVAIAISREKIVLPKNVCAHVLPKTSLSQRGLLALSTGVIDPGYSGYVGTTLINFTRSRANIRAGEAFLRVVFSEIDNPIKCTARYPEEDYEEYRSKLLRAASNYPETFLDVPSTAYKVAKTLLWQTITIAALAVALLGLFAVFVPHGVQSYLLRETAIKQIVAEELRVLHSEGGN